MSRNTKFPIVKVTTRRSSTDEENDHHRYVVNKPFPLCKGLRCHNEYICTGLSSAPLNQPDIKLSLGYTDLTQEGLKIMKCSEYQIHEECRREIFCTPFQTEWVPSHPQLLAVATDDIRFYEYQNQNLTFREKFLEQVDNPIISMDWDRRHPEEILITRSDGQVAILSMSYGIPIELIGYRRYPEGFLHSEYCGARFGKREMEHCIFLVEEYDYFNRIKVFDRQFLALNYHSPWLDDFFLNVECSKHSGYLIALLTRREVFLHDLRYFREPLASFHYFESEEYATCFCWSPHAPELYIGTTTGGVVKWRIDDGMAERYYNQNKRIASIHCRDANPDLLFSTCYELPTDPYPSIIEVYSVQSL